MTLKTLHIELQTWGERKGAYDVTITVTESRNEIQMVLPPDIGVALIAQAKDFIHNFSRKAADDLHKELMIAEPERKALEA